MGLSIPSSGYNIFVTGLPGTRRLRTVEELVRRAYRRPRRARDLAFVMNWDDPDRPLLLRFEAGRASVFRRDVEGLVRFLRRSLPRVVAAGSLGARRDRVAARYRAEEQRLLGRFERRARADGFVVLRKSDEQGVEELDLQYLLRGRPQTLDRLEELGRRGRVPARELRRARARYDELRTELEGVMRRGRTLEARMSDELGDLEEAAAERVVRERIGRIGKRHRGDEVGGYLDGLRRAVLRDLDLFLDGDERPVPGPESRQDPFSAYRVNVILDARRRATPPVVEAHPTYRNLFGAVERLERPGGALFADFNTIRAGSLLRADGGVLIMHADDVLDEPNVFRALKRFLRSGLLEIQDPDSAAFAPTALKPEPIDLDVKVILVGEEDIYESIWHEEPEFETLFKVKAEFDDCLPFDRTTARAYVGWVAALCRDEGLAPLDREALCRVLDEARRRTGRSRLLTARLSEVGDLVREASHAARRRGGATVAGKDVAAAAVARERRQGLVEERLRWDVRQGVVRIETSGARVGAINSLVVFDVGGYSFGRPSRVTASVAPGTAGVVSIEREAQLSGRTHDKGVLVLAGYLRGRFASRIPLSLSASLCLEQSYGGVDGDSASLAECLALLSALAGVPLRQGYAVTGSLDQHGTVQAVGALTEKVEGFFKLARERRFPRPSGVILPSANEHDLMVADDVADAVRRGVFEVHVVSRVEDALALMAAPLDAAEVMKRAEERLQSFDLTLRRRRPRDLGEGGEAR